jgi:ZIP family zinc transporter
MELVWGLAIPFLGTALGSFMVFFMKNQMNKKLEKLLLGFASGVMIAASVWSLLIPSIDMAKEQNVIEWLPASLGFLLGIFFLLILDSIIPHLHLNSDKPEGLKAKLEKTTMMVLAVTLHNIPEGMAVGIAFGSIAYGLEGATAISACILALGIGIQNFPEGSAVSIPLRREGYSRLKSFLYGSMSGIVEPIAGIIGALLVLKMRFLLPFLLSFAAGAMIYVVVEEIIPESQTNKKKDLMALFTIIGFLIMMVLDVMLG